MLYLVTDSVLCGDRSLEDVVESAIRGGVNIVQLREKDATDKEFLRKGRSLQEICRSYNIPFIINDRVDIAAELDADGVHLGQLDGSYELAREELGSNKIIGLTVNNLEQARQAQDINIDYLGVGPIFPTTTKLDAGEAWEVEDLKKLREISRQFLIGIGGIDSKNALDVMQLGLNGIAVVSAICGADCPKSSAQELAECFRHCERTT